MPRRKYLALLILLAFVLFSCNPPDEEIVYDYSLADINASSVTYGENIGPGYFTNQVSVHYFGHQYWGLCTFLLGKLNSLYGDLQNEGIESVKIIAIGKGQYSGYNSHWTEESSIPVVADPSPNALWTSWGASQWDIFFLDSNGGYITDYSLEEYTVIGEDSSRVFQYSKVYNQIKDILPE